MNSTSQSQTRFGRQHARPPQYQGVQTFSYYLTMRDGVKIAVEVVLPKNLPQNVRLPVLLTQTRYWRAMELRSPFKWFLIPEQLNADYKNFKPFFTSRGYALVTADVRGTGASFGVWPYPWSEACIGDALEIVNWIAKQPWSNGRIGAYGISYLGTTAELLPAIQHPAVQAVIPMFNHPDAYVDIAFPGGVLNRRFLKDWGDFDRTLDNNIVPDYYGFWGRLLVRGVKPVENSNGRQLLQEAVKAHKGNGSVYRLAQQVTFRDEHREGIDICVDDLTVHKHREKITNAALPTFGFGSWMDAGTADAVLRRFLTFENAHRAVIGAWEHGGRYHASPYKPSNLPSDPPLASQWVEMLRFFDCYLKDEDNGLRDERALYYYTLGEERWKKSSTWPPSGTEMERWYFSADRQLTPAFPNGMQDADIYQVDFKASSGEHNRWWEMSSIVNKTVMYPDRAGEQRHLLSYTSQPLQTDIEISGYPVMNLFASSTEPDVVFYVYLEDVDESGRVTYITEGLLRAIHRKISNENPPYKLQVPYHSFKQSDAMPLVPGETAQISFGLLPTSVRIKKGHHLRVSIAGHDEGTFERVPAQGTPVFTIERNQECASNIELPILRF